MTAPKTFAFRLLPPFEPEPAGLFISPGNGRHPDRTLPSYELVFVRSGVLHIEEAGRHFAVRPGECLLLRPGRRHRGLREYERNLSFYWIHFHSRSRGGRPLRLPQHSRPPRPGELTQLFRRYLDDQETDSLLPAQAGCLIAQMLVEIGRPPVHRPQNDQSLAGRAERYIAAEFVKGIHAGDVARAVDCHPDYLGRVYRKTFGCTLSNGIHRKQISEARYLLRESSKNLSEIALACGFRETRYFRALFARMQGMSPRAYRRLYARVSVNTR